MGQILKEIGELLQTSREEQGIDLDSISCQLKVCSGYLAALEEGDVKRLPEEVYVLGYLRGYARILGLNANEIINRFQQDKDIATIKPAFIFPDREYPYSQKSRKRGASLKRFASGMLAIVAISVIWYHGKILQSVNSFYPHKAPNAVTSKH